MTKQTQTHKKLPVTNIALTEGESALGAALIDLWGEDLNLNAHLMMGLRDLAERAGKEPVTAAIELEFAILDAKKAVTPGLDLIKAQVVAALLHEWSRVQQHLRQKVIKAVRDRAILAGSDPDLTLAALISVLEQARHSSEILAEKHAALEKAQKAKDAQRSGKYGQQVRRQKELKTLQGR